MFCINYDVVEDAARHQDACLAHRFVVLFDYTAKLILVRQLGEHKKTDGY